MLVGSERLVILLLWWRKWYFALLRQGLNAWYCVANRTIPRGFTGYCVKGIEASFSKVYKGPEKARFPYSLSRKYYRRDRLTSSPKRNSRSATTSSEPPALVRTVVSLSLTTFLADHPVPTVVSCRNVPHNQNSLFPPNYFWFHFFSWINYYTFCFTKIWVLFKHQIDPWSSVSPQGCISTVKVWYFRSQ